MFPIQPYIAGYAYGSSTILDDKNAIQKYIEHPFLTTIDIVAHGSLYSLLAEKLSQKIIPEHSHKAFSIGLMALAAYNCYRFVRRNLKKNDSSDNSSKEETQETQETKKEE